MDLPNSICSNCVRYRLEALAGGPVPQHRLGDTQVRAARPVSQPILLNYSEKELKRESDRKKRKWQTQEYIPDISDLKLHTCKKIELRRVYRVRTLYFGQ